MKKRGKCVIHTNQIIKYIADSYSISIYDLMYDKQGSIPRLCRKAAIYLIHLNIPKMSYKGIANKFYGMDKKKIKRAIHSAETILNKPKEYRAMSGALIFLKEGVSSLCKNAQD